MNIYYRIRFTLGVAVLLLLTTASAFAAPLQQTNFKEISGSPLRIEVGDNASVQVYHEKTGNTGAAFGTADSGFFLAIGTDIYGPDLENTNDSSASFATNRFTLVNQEGPTGVGSITDPFKIVTNQTMNGSGADLTIAQTVSYINGEDYFRQDRAITNNGNSEVCFKAYHAADVFFAGSDTGAGYYNPATGSVGGKGKDNTDNDWFMVFTPVTPATHYQEGHYSSQIWNAVQTATDLNDSIDPAVIDNGFALQWDVCVQPGETTTISDLWSFGENEEAVIPPPLPTVTPTPPPADVDNNSKGDVHISTPDGLVYDFQARGDFLLTQSTSGDVVLQARQDRWETYPDRPVSVNTAVAMNVGGDKLEFYLKPERSFYINDVLTDLPTGFVALPAGGNINLSGTGSTTDFTITWPDGNTGARVVLYDVYIDIGIARLAGSLTYEGVLGNMDGDTQNDIQLRDGDLITYPANADDLKRFGDSWRLSAAESLFNDPLSDGDSAEEAGPLTLGDLDPAERDTAQNTCETAGVTDPLALHNCTYDVAVTGDDSFVDSAISFEEDIEDNAPEEEFVAAVPSQGLPAAPAAPTAEVELVIGQQYAVGDVPGTFRYFQLTAFPTDDESRATLNLCPDLEGVGLVVVSDIMTEEMALAQGLEATNEPCVETEVEVDEETETPDEVDEEAVTTDESDESGSDESPTSGLCNAPMMLPLLLGFAFMRGKRRKED